MKFLKKIYIVYSFLIIAFFIICLMLSIYVKKRESKIKEAVKKELKECGKDYNEIVKNI